MEPIDEKVKAAWRRSIKERQVWPETYEHVDVLADAYLHERAMRQKAEWRVEHNQCKAEQIVMLNPDRNFIEWSCRKPDEHAMTDADWKAKVCRELEGEK